jgi:hypothetical protein
VADESEVVKFFGGVTAKGHIERHGGWRGHSTVTVGREGIYFALDFAFRGIGHRYVEYANLAYVYPVQSRRLSPTSLAAAIVPAISNTAIRFVTRPVGALQDRDDYAFTPDNGVIHKLIDLLEELGYPIDRRLRVRKQIAPRALQDHLMS